jgi:hypothetical protein
MFIRLLQELKAALESCPKNFQHSGAAAKWGVGKPPGKDQLRVHLTEFSINIVEIRFFN